MEENNKLLAEFIWAKVTDLKGNQKPIYYPILGASHTKLKFHRDWNWLMLVVDKIESLNKTVQIERGICHIHNGGIHHGRSTKTQSKIEATYNACVEFVKWYNENKN